jgi:replicative DNA helicase
MNNSEYTNKRKIYKAVPLLSGVEEIRQDFEERLEQGDTVYGFEILDDFVETIRKGSLTFILARPNCLALNQSVLTEKGFIKVSDLRSDEKVYGNDGKLYDIISFVDNKNEYCFTIGFSNGTEITTSDSHEWLINVNGENKLFTTSYLFEFYNNTDKAIQRFKVPVFNSEDVNIKYVVPAVQQDTRCITTNNPAHELITDNYIVTRNCGKSLLGQIIACNLAKQGKKVLICSCEMGSGLLMERQLINLTGVSMGQLRQLYANRRDVANKILDSVIEDNKYDYLRRIDIAETGGATVEDIMQLLDCEKDCDYAIIDYIQRIKGQGTEYENITNAARELQTYARRTGKRLIICSQAKRPSSTNNNTTDAGSAGKGSGSIEEDGDVGLLLSELFENGQKKILATLFKNRFGAKQKTYKYLMDERLNLRLESKNAEVS